MSIKMDEQARAFDVRQESDAEAGAWVRAFDQAGQIGDDERAAEFAIFAVRLARCRHPR